jgi:hypothetical protein
MKKLLILGIAALATAGTLQSCKKGENDPFLSLRSRKARLAGEWKLTSSENKNEQTYMGTTTTSTRTYDGTTETLVMTPGGTSTSEYTITLTIEKDGTYTRVYTEDGETTTTKGTWIFLNRSKENELKNKEAIMLTQTSTSEGGETTTMDDLNGEVIEIDQLKSKEMIWKTYYSYSNDTGSETNTFTGTFTQE